MGTTTKALQLLDYFTAAEPSIGLSTLTRLSGHDKATVFRLLSELRSMGFVEQSAATKLFRLGPAVIRLANVREQTFPIRAATQERLAILVEAVRETAHVTQLQGLHLSPVHKLNSQHHATHARIDPSQILPLHATASGCAVLAFSDDDLLDRVLAEHLPALTAGTRTDADGLRAKVLAARASGFGYSSGEFETETSSVAVPYFGSDGACLGAISVVGPSARMTDQLKQTIRFNLKPASLAITTACGGHIPATLLRAWAKSGEDPTTRIDL